MPSGGPLVFAACEHASVATTFTVADLLADAAALTNSPAFSSTTRITSTRATYWLTQGVRALSALLREYHYEDREFLQTTTLQTVAGTKTVALPANCGEVHAVLWARAADDYELLQTAAQISLLESGDEGWELVAPRYRLEGEALAFYPAPDAVYDIELFYTTDLGVGLGSSFQTRLDGDRWITLYVAEKVQQAKRKSVEVRELMQQRAILEASLLGRARERDASRTDTIRDVRRERAYAAHSRHWRRG